MGADQSTIEDVITLSDDDTESTTSVHTGNEDNVHAIGENVDSENEKDATNQEIFNQAQWENTILVKLCDIIQNAQQ